MKELPIEIRTMRPEDADEVVYVVRRLPDFFHEGGAKHVGRSVAEGDGMVAVYGGQIVGFAIYEVRPPTVEILWIGVLPFYQGRGVGKRLLDAVCGQVRRQGHQVDRTEVRTLAPGEDHAGYERTRAFYEGIGFHQAGIDKRYYADGSDAVVYSRRIEAR